MQKVEDSINNKMDHLQSLQVEQGSLLSHILSTSSPGQGLQAVLYNTIQALQQQLGEQQLQWEEHKAEWKACEDKILALLERK